MNARAGLPVRLVLMLAIGLLINYIDRGSIGVAAPLLQKELGLSTEQLGYVFSAFFWAYVPLQPVMGWLADKLGAARVLAGGFLLWSAATAVAGFAESLTSLIALRVVMGIGESTFYPCAVSLLASRVDDRYRTRATSTVTLGGVWGPAAGTLLGGLVMIQHGWRAMFIGLGLASLLWLIPWLNQLRRDGLRPKARANGGPGLQAILKQRALWGAMLGVFCSNYTFYFIFAWLPLYLVQERGLSLLDMTQLTTWIYVVDGIAVLTVGWLLDAWIKKGASFDKAYKTTLVASALGVGACLIGCTMAGMTVAVVLLLLLGLMDGLNNPTTPAVTQKFAGPQAAGRWMGLQNAVANVSGVAGPLITGKLVDMTHDYTAALYVAGTVGLIGAATWLFIVPPVRTVDWAKEGAR